MSMVVDLLLAAGQQPRPPGMDWQFLLLVAGVPLLLFWLFVMRPQRKQQREREQLLSQLKHNDEVVTIGGIVGSVQSIKEKAGGVAGEEDVIVLRIDDKTRLKVLRSSINRVLRKDEAKKESESTGSR